MFTKDKDIRSYLLGEAVENTLIVCGELCVKQEAQTFVLYSVFDSDWVKNTMVRCSHLLLFTRDF